MKHYLLLSLDHLERKYSSRTYDQRELEMGWHGWRARISSEIGLPGAEELEQFTVDDDLKTTNPRKRHIIDERMERYEIERFFVKPGYTSYPTVEYFDGSVTASTGVTFQPEVYPVAAEIARRQKCSYIIDIGCGRGGKLVPLASEFEIIGVDFGKNIEYCKSTHAAGRWIELNIERDNLELPGSVLEQSLIICSDMIEHLLDPGKVLALLKRMLADARGCVISTPERDLVRGVESDGPPSNRSHVREWNTEEFVRLLNYYGMRISHVGLTYNNDRDMERKNIMVVLENTEGKYPLDLQEVAGIRV